jgi:hypothetical protein
MVIYDKQGIAVMEETPFNNDEASVKWYNDKYGPKGWRFIPKICDYLEPSCGYGKPLTPGSCHYCNGLCMRPDLVAISNAE